MYSYFSEIMKKQFFEMMQEIGYTFNLMTTLKVDIRTI